MSEILKKIAAHAAGQPDHPAVIALRPGGRVDTLSYGQLRDAVARCAAILGEQLNGPAIVPIIAAKSADCVVAMLGVLATGSAFAVLNRKLKAPQLNAAIAAAKPLFGIIDGDGASIVAANSTEAFAGLPWLRLSELAAGRDKQSGPVGRFDWAGNAPGCCLFTSGSTGHPKGVLISAGDLDRRARAEADLYALTRDDVLLCVLPFSFDVGLNQLLSGLFAGGTVVLSESWLPADMLRSVAHFSITGISGVPAVWNDLITSSLRFHRTAEHASLRYITVSGGDLPVDRLLALAGAVDGAAIYKTYGQSETFRSAALKPDEFAQRPGSVGRAFGDAKLYVIRPDGTAAGVNEPGEIVHAGPGTLLGYLDGPATCLGPNLFHGPADPNSIAVFTGDTGYLDSGGYLFVVGREDSMLKIAGNRVYPKEITDQLLAIPGVAEAEVIGRKEATGETQLFAFVAAAPAASLDPAAVRRMLMARVPSYMVPRSVTILDSLPKTANGKIDRPALIARLTELCDQPTKSLFREGAV